MSNLHDVVELQEKPKFGGLTEELLEELAKRDQVVSLVGKELHGLQKEDTFARMANNMESTLELRRQTTFELFGGNLPKEIEQTIAITESRRSTDVDFFVDDYLTHASKMPKGAVGNLREIADKLGFIIAPYMYVRDEVLDLAKMPRKSENPATNFYTKMVKNFDVHVLGPLSIYDINKHVQTEEQADVYWDLDNPVIASIEMVLPALRALNTKIGDVEVSVGKMATQLDRLEKQVAENQRQAAMANVDSTNRIASLSAREFTRVDPLIFAVKQNTDIRTSNTFAFLGPCWGEDFKAIVFTALGLEIKAGQRKVLAK